MFSNEGELDRIYNLCDLVIDDGWALVSRGFLPDVLRVLQSLDFKVDVESVGLDVFRVVRSDPRKDVRRSNLSPLEKGANRKKRFAPKEENDDGEDTS